MKVPSFEEQRPQEPVPSSHLTQAIQLLLVLAMLIGLAAWSFFAWQDGTLHLTSMIMGTKVKNSNGSSNPKISGHKNGHSKGSPDHPSSGPRSSMGTEVKLGQSTSSDADITVQNQRQGIVADGTAADGITAPGEEGSALVGSDNFEELPLIRIELLQDVGVQPRVDLNRASAEQLKLLPGVSDSLAKAIVSYREQQLKYSLRMPFINLEDLAQVPGMTLGRLAPLQPFVTTRGSESGAQVGSVGYGDDEPQQSEQSEPRLSTTFLPLSRTGSDMAQLLSGQTSLKLAAAQAVGIEFSSLSTPLQAPLRLYDGQGNLVATYAGRLGQFRTRAVHGSEIKLRSSANPDQLKVEIRGIFGISTTY